jgi:hypothetical protein
LALTNANSSTSRGQAACKHGLAFGFNFVLSRRDENPFSLRFSASFAATAGAN